MLDMILHIFRTQYVVNQHQGARQLSTRAVLRGVGDPGVAHAACCHAKEVAILRYHDSAIIRSHPQVHFVRRSQGSGLRDRKHIDAIAAQARYYGL